MNDKKKKFWVRLMAIALAVLMVGGTLYSTIATLLIG